ncbi:cellular tumor antigen p53-like [Anopheles coustani]|uniref:cellular tumor antigen p53-like n=2 Tax=coustani group TaxID=59130 RepID=UPI0026582CB1|nr:cellular tumor antigen p53-like [Anopheles coustani]
MNMNMSLSAETFGEIPNTMPSQCDDYGSLSRLDTKELLPSMSLIGTEVDNLYIDGNLDVQELYKYGNEQYPVKTEMTPLAYKTFVDHALKMPELEDLQNQIYNFNVELKGEGSKAWAFSNKLKKLYVKKKQALTVSVSYRNTLPDTCLNLRVMLVCSSPQDIHRPVCRCQHDISKDTVQLEYLKDHVVRCLNPEATYIGQTGGVAFKDRLAMMIQLQGVGDQVTPVSLEFWCQNSCPTIERRATSLVFTLENEHGAILGRNSINVKICSCPKRDMDKEEGKGVVGGKRKHDAHNNSITTDDQPPRKLTRQSSQSCIRPARSVATTNQHDIPVPSTSAITPFDCVKKETPYVPISRSSSTISNTAVENDNTAIPVNLRLPDIATAVEVVEYAFKHISADMVRCANEEKRNRLATFLAHCRRMKSKYSQFL